MWTLKFWQNNQLGESESNFLAPICQFCIQLPEARLERMTSLPKHANCRYGARDWRVAGITNLSDPHGPSTGHSPQAGEVIREKADRPARELIQKNKSPSIPSHHNSEHPNCREAKLIKCYSTVVRRLPSIKFKTYIVFMPPDKSL